MKLVTTQPITACAFPTPPLILRVNDPAAQRGLRAFAHEQAVAAQSLHRTLAETLRENLDIGGRAAVFTTVFEAAEDWRYRIAETNQHLGGRYGAHHVERFRTPVTDDNPNLFRIGEHKRFKDGAAWNPITRTYEGGAETPASRTIRQFHGLAAARFTHSPSADAVSNRVTLPDGHTAHGMRLLRGDAARHAATEMAARIASRGGDTSRIITDGDLIYIASPPETDRRTIFHGAMTLLAQAHATPAAALTAWLRVAYMLYQAPRRKRGSDATTRTFLIATGIHLLTRPPQLLHDVDLRAYVRPEAQFVAELRTAQDGTDAEPEPR